jgi:hypothetical protein
VAATTLALQVLLTRLFSAVLFYHFGFLAISLALLGAGAGAIAVYVRPRWFGRSGTALARWSLALALSLVLVPLVLVRLDYTHAADVNAGFVATLAAACLLAALPFVAAGVAIALAIRDYTAWSGRVYAADLAGAGLGALAIVPLLRVLDPATLIVALGAVAGVAAILFAPPAGRERRTGLLVAGVGAVMAVVAASSSLYYLDPWTGVKPPYERWTPLSRVIGYAPESGARVGAMSYDRVATPVALRSRAEPPPSARELSLLPQSVGFALVPGGRTLVIGGGGGRDIYNALSSGQRAVDVIELNQGIVRMVDDDLGRWSGSPYSYPGVSTEVGDGRSELAARDTRYDQVHVGFTDTLSANSAAAFALTEANLYTVEALDEYFDHLRPGGLLSLSRQRRLVGDEALRITVLALESLERRGASDPERNVVVLLGRDVANELFGTVLARERPYTARELARIRALARERGVRVAYAPGGPYVAEWAQLARAPSARAFCEGYRLDVCAPTDDRPFFFNMRRLADVGKAPGPGYIYAVDPFRVLVLTALVLAVLSALALVLPLLLVRGESRPTLRSLGFFAAIGLGFLLLEVVLIQRFVLYLGFPTYALSVVLFALLVFTGLGSLLSTRLPGDPRRVLAAALAVAALLILAGAFGLQPLLRALIDLPFAARVAVSALLLAPYGLALGMAMPIGLQRLAALYPGGVPWAWGVNGVMSVLASVLGVTVALVAGFTATTLLAAACYLAALLHVLLEPWPERERLSTARGPRGGRASARAAADRESARA